MSSAFEIGPVTKAIEARTPGRERTSVRTTPIGRRVDRRDEFEVVGLLVGILVVLFILALSLGVTPLA